MKAILNYNGFRITFPHAKYANRTSNWSHKIEVESFETASIEEAIFPIVEKFTSRSWNLCVTVTDENGYVKLYKRYYCN